MGGIRADSAQVVGGVGSRESEWKTIRAHMVLCL